MNRKQARVFIKHIAAAERKTLQSKIAAAKFLSLVDLILTVPASTADCERGFNQMKLVKSDWRSRLTSRSLCDLLTVQLSSPSIENYDPTPAIQLWHQASIRPRRPEFMEGKKNAQESTSETSESDSDEQA